MGQQKTMHVETEMCGTCEYWLGERLLTENNRGNSIVKFGEVTAGCRCRQSKFYGASRDYNRKCLNYKRWEKTEK